MVAKTPLIFLLEICRREISEMRPFSKATFLKSQIVLLIWVGMLRGDLVEPWNTQNNRSLNRIKRNHFKHFFSVSKLCYFSLRFVRHLFSLNYYFLREAYARYHVRFLAYRTVLVWDMLYLKLRDTEVFQFCREIWDRLFKNNVQSNKPLLISNIEIEEAHFSACWNVLELHFKWHWMCSRIWQEKVCFIYLREINHSNTVLKAVQLNTDKRYLLHLATVTKPKKNQSVRSNCIFRHEKS